MATNGNVMNVIQPSIPIFKRESYEFWSIKMKTLFRYQERDLVENGSVEPDDDPRLTENKKKDSKALLFIQ